MIEETTEVADPNASVVIATTTVIDPKTNLSKELAVETTKREAATTNALEAEAAMAVDSEETDSVEKMVQEIGKTAMVVEALVVSEPVEVRPIPLPRQRRWPSSAGWNEGSRKQSQQVRRCQT